MIRKYDALYRIDGQPLLTPDADVEIQMSDMESGDSGLDESGVLHRIVVREKVRTWSFSYATLDDADYRYLQSLFAGKPTFTFQFPSGGQAESCMAYCDKTSVVLHNSRTGLYKNLKFNIMEC